MECNLYIYKKKYVLNFLFFHFPQFFPKSFLIYIYFPHFLKINIFVFAHLFILHFPF